MHELSQKTATLTQQRIRVKMLCSLQKGDFFYFTHKKT